MGVEGIGIWGMEVFFLFLLCCFLIVGDWNYGGWFLGWMGLGGFEGIILNKC